MLNCAVQFVAQVEENQGVPLGQLQIYHVVVSLMLSAEYLQNKLHFYL